MKPYKDWRIQYKILVAAVVPFLLAVLISIPFVTHKIIQNIEEHTKAYLSEVAYRTAVEIKFEIKNLISQVHILSNTLESLIKEENYNRELVESILKNVAEKNKYLTGVWSIWEHQPFQSNLKAEDTFSLTGKFIPYWTKKSGELKLTSFKNHNIIFDDSFNQTIGPYNSESMLSPYYINIDDSNVLAASIYKPLFDNEGNLATIVGIDIAFSEFISLIDELKTYGITHAALISEDKIVLQYAKDPTTDYHDDLLLWKKIKPSIIKDQEYITERFDNNLKQDTFTIVEPIQISEFGKVWGLIVDLPRDPIIFTVYKNTLFISIIITICVIIGIIVSMITARNIAIPISIISEALKSISLSKHNIMIPTIDSNDEVGQMARSAHIFKKNALDLAEAKQQAELANVAKSEFINNISHELRTPLHAMLSYSQLGLEKVKATEPKLYKYFINIKSSSERLLRLVNDLLDLSKIESGKMEFNFVKNDILKCIKSVQSELKSLMKEKKIEFKIHHQITTTEFIFDYEKLIQVLINIVSNAIKFSPENSLVTLNLTKETLANMPEILIALEDKGIGIPEQELESVFDKFTQSNSAKNENEGTGLGLSIAKSIVNAHGGKIWAENAPIQGAIIKIILPLTPPQLAA